MKTIRKALIFGSITEIISFGLWFSSGIPEGPISMSVRGVGAWLQMVGILFCGFMHDSFGFFSPVTNEPLFFTIIAAISWIFWIFFWYVFFIARERFNKNP